MTFNENIFFDILKTPLWLKDINLKVSRGDEKSKVSRMVNNNNDWNLMSTSTLVVKNKRADEEYEKKGNRWNEKLPFLRREGGEVEG